jgi:hypothetical protein
MRAWSTIKIFILEIIKAWIVPAQKSPKTISRIWHVRRGWRDDKAEIENAVMAQRRIRLPPRPNPSITALLH